MDQPSVMHRACALFLVLLLAGLLFAAASSAAPVENPRPSSPPFAFSVDQCSVAEGQGASGGLLSIRRNAALPRGETLTLSGWLTTEKGVSGYQFMWVPSGGGMSGGAVGGAAWQTVPEADIFARPDLTAAQIPYSGGHSTAGFNLVIPTPAELADGYYDVFLRAKDSAGNPCDFLAFVHLRYGNADGDDGITRRINFDRLAAEAAETPDVFRGGAALADNGILLPPNGRVRLGELDATAYESVSITYRTVSGKPLSADPRAAILGLASSGVTAFGQAGEPYNMTYALAYGFLTTAEDWLTLDLEAVHGTGEVWLTGHLSEAVLITSIEFTYMGNGSDRVAARIHLSEDLLPARFSGPNKVTLSGVRDPLLGDVLRIEVSEDTNDPFVHFHAEQVLDEADISLSADVYRYMVVLARAMPQNSRPHICFYLCAGTITNATEACTYAWTLQTDGEWHYYLLDLTEKDTWRGMIHGWRFDIISGECHAGDAVEFASVQFFRTPEAATAAAVRPVSEAPVYNRGEPAVYLDMVEEQGSGETLNPADTYIETKPETEPEPETLGGTESEVQSEPETEADTTPPPETDAQTDVDEETVLPPPSDTAEEIPAQTQASSENESREETQAESREESVAVTVVADSSADEDTDNGCASALPAAGLLFPTVGAGIWWSASKKKRRTPRNRA